MDDLESEFRKLKISALSKLVRINQNIGPVSIGPNSIQIENKSPEAKRIISENDENKPISPAQNNKNKLKTSPTLLESKNGNNFKNYKILIEDYELNRKEQVEEAINARRNTIIKFNKQQEELHRKSWKQQQMKLIAQMEQQELSIIQKVNQIDLNAKLEHEKVEKFYKEQAERTKKNLREIERKEEANRKIKQNIDSILKSQQDFNSVFIEIIGILKDCDEQIKNSIMRYTTNLNLLPPQMDAIINKVKDSKMEEEDVIKSRELVNSAKVYRDEIKKGIIARCEMELQRAQEVAKREQIEDLRKEEAQAQEKLKKPQEQISDSAINMFVSQESFKFYTELQIFLQNHEKNLASLIGDDALKNFRFSCKKAVNIPVNAISAVNSKHLQDKYNKLYNLLAGKVVKIGDDNFNPSRHPQGVAFSMNVLANKFVLQGDLMVSSNPESAFCYAAMIVALWNEFPDFGKLLLAHFHKECPYLVPIYHPQISGQTDQNYYQNLGYKYKDGEIEKQDKYLKRMTGIFRLYFAILITKPRTHQNKHPHDISNGWRWIASILNLEPRVDITATAIHVFLEVVGSSMQAIYGKQFKKITDFILAKYIVLIKKIDSGGPMVRLETMLQDFMKTGHFAVPSGQLSNDFW